MPKVALKISDHSALCGIAIFDDGVMAIMDEKAYVELGADGCVLQKCWKEEPTGAYYKAICDQKEEVQAPSRTDKDSATAFEALCFALAREPEIVGDIAGS